MDPELAKAMAKLAGYIHEHLPGQQVEVYQDRLHVNVKIDGHGRYWLTPQMLLYSALEPEDLAQHIVDEVKKQDGQRMPPDRFDPYDPQTWGSDKSASDTVDGHRD